MHTGQPNHPVHNKMKQRENIADQCAAAAVTPSNVQFTLLHSFCGQKIFSRGAKNGTKGKISDHSQDLYKGNAK